MTIGTSYIIKYLSDTSDAVKGATALEQLNKDIATNIGQQYANATRIIGQTTNKITAPQTIKINGQEAIRQVQTLGIATEHTDGTFRNFVTTTTLINGQVANTKTTMADVTNQFKQTAIESEKNQKNFKTLGENIDFITKRAALTIPLWIALRGVFLGFPRAINDSIKSLIDLDLALQKVRRNMQGTPDEIAANFDILKTKITETSLATGVDVAKIAEAVKKFASLGFQMDEAISGGIDATKLSVVLFGDAAETADSFARALNLLIDRSKGAASAQQQMKELFALTAELEKTNQFEIGEVNEALKNFGNTAKSFNINGHDTLAILATLGTNLLEGAKGGTLAASAFQQMFTNLSKVGRTLGVQINPQVDSTTQVLLKVIGAISDLNKSNPQKATQAINDLFGGVKGGKVVRSLISDLERLRENLNIKVEADSLDQQLSNVLKTASGQARIFQNLGKQAGISFATAITGAKNFETAIAEVNKAMQFLVEVAQVAGEDLRAVLSLGLLPLSDAIIAETDKADKAIQVFGDKVIAGLKGKLSPKELEGVFNELIKKQSELQNEIQTVSAIGNINEQKRLTSELNGLYATQQALKEQMFKKEVQLTDQVKATTNAQKSQTEEVTISFLDQQKIGELVLQSQLDLLKAEGASSLQIINANIEWRKQLGLIDESTNKADAQLKILERQLDKEKAINEEKRLQGKLSSDTLKLFDIAKTEGVNVAKQIGDVLAGNTSLDLFIRAGGRAAEVFQKEFADLFKQKQAEAFFTGNAAFPGIAGLGFGSSIPIPGNEAIRGNSFDIAFANTLAKRQFNQLNPENQQIKTNNVTLTADKVELSSQLAPVQGALAPIVTTARTAEENRQLAIRGVNTNNLTPINFDSGAIRINISPSLSKEEAQKLINETMIRIGTPGTPENKQLTTTIVGNKQTNTL